VTVIREEGSSVVEFAIVVPLVFLFLVASLELVAVTRVQLQVTHAAREGARQAATSPDPADAVQAVRSALPANLVSRARVIVERPHVVGQQARVRVEISYRFAGFAFGGLTLDLGAQSVMRVER
jgi:Flp pilus assembly protein TadG